MSAVIQFSDRNHNSLAVVPKKLIYSNERFNKWAPTTETTSFCVKNLVTEQTESLAPLKKYECLRIFRETGLYFHNLYLVILFKP